MAVNQPINDGAMRLEGAQRGFFIFRGEPAVAKHVSSKNRGKATLLTFFNHTFHLPLLNGLYLLQVMVGSGPNTGFTSWPHGIAA